MYQLTQFGSNGARKAIFPEGELKANEDVVFYMVDGWYGTIITKKAHRLGDRATYYGLVSIVNPSDSVLQDALRSLSLAQCVYFEGVAWMGHGFGKESHMIVGVSAKAATMGSQLKNTADKDAFRRHVLDDKTVKFESLNNPGLYMSVDGTRVVLGKPNGMNEIFQEVPALNGIGEPFVSFESRAHPGCYLVHCDGRMYCHGFDNKLQLRPFVFKNDATWRLSNCEDTLEIA